MQYYNSEQEIITYINLDSEEKKFKFINHIYEDTLSIVKKVLATHDFDFDIQNMYLTQFKPNIKMIETARNQLYQLLGHHDRAKRGWFDFVGIIAKELFGVMDHQDAETIDEKLNEFEKSENLLASTIKHQSEVVRSTIINFNNTVSTIKSHEEMFNNNMKTFRLALNKNAAGAEIVAFQLAADEHLMQLSHFINSLRIEYETLTNAILFSKKGILHPSIMTPEQLYKNLQDLIPKIASGLHLPIPSQVENSHLLLNIIDLVVYFYNSKLVFIIKIPLLSELYFDTYKLISMPVKISNFTYAFIKPKEDFLSIRGDKQKYIMISESEINKCKDFSRKFLCRQNEPFFDTYNSGNCETKIVLQQQIDIQNECDIRISKFKNSIWHRLHQRNSWLYVLNSQKMITLSCKDQHETQETRIQGSGIFSLNEKCVAYVDNIMLEPSHIYSAIIERDFSPSFNICKTVCVDDKLKKINISYVNFHSDINPNVYKLDDLNLASAKLKDIEYYANFILNHKNHSSTTTMLTYVVCFIVTIVIIYLLFRCLIKPMLKSRCCRNISSYCCPGITINNRIEAQPRVQQLELNQLPLEATSISTKSSQRTYQKGTKLFK